jgi:alpha-glucuronidase
MRPLKLLLVAALAVQSAATWAENGAAGWLRYPTIQNTLQYNSLPTRIVALDHSLVIQSAAAEAARGLTWMLGRPITISQNVAQPVFVIATVTEVQTRFPKWKPSTELGPEGYVIAPIRDHGHTDWLIVGADPRGVLYGTFHLLQQIAEERSLSQFAITSSPAEQIRWVNQWDNLDGSIERGYAGSSIFFNDGQVRPDLTRASDYARLLASIGINGCAVNNVNADLRILTPQMIPQLARIADAFRPWGVHLVLSVDLSSPKSIGGLSTYDPLDPQVIAWWQKKVDDLYAHIPTSAASSSKLTPRANPVPRNTDAAPPTPPTCSRAPSSRTAECSFNGTYTIAVQYFDYLHGASTFTLFLNQKPIANWRADNSLPADTMNGDPSTRYTLSNIDLHPGDKLKIEGQPDDGEPAPLDYVIISASAKNE